ncbi:hypothetical protein P12x_003899 [Tundrisphaera lichenicola]|uniref:hypothetical protein n=1 Tax=Tundrisphaera lichenicola TaxID=2029860 RepID=UPI003EB805F1
MGNQLGRRAALRAGLVAMASPVALGLAQQPVRSVRAFRLIEMAGLRRFGFPVHTIIPDAFEGRNFRLLRNGRSIPAQFRVVKGATGRDETHLDFIASPEPLEVGQYQVLFGREIEPGPEPKDGLSLQERDGHYLVILGGTTTFEIDRSSTNFLRSVGSARLPFLDELAGGLRILTNGVLKPPSSPESGQSIIEVTRHGPMAVGFRSVQSWSDSSKIRLELTIPSSKSWIEVIATIDDPGGKVEGLQFDLDLKIEGSPTLVDLGAGSTVYGQIKDDERMEMTAELAIGNPDRTSWIVRKGRGSAPDILATSTAQSPQSPEGWAHVMDNRRCSALGIAQFGNSGARDLISVEANGRTRILRKYALPKTTPPPGSKSLTFWLHFVPMPVQVGAATSPQSMMAPLLVEWDRPPHSL